MPGNPFEAELIMMAEMAEGQKKSLESEENNSAGKFKCKYSFI